MRMNPNYRGALTDYHIQNSTATASDNCAVRIHGINKAASVRDILQKVTTGKIFSVNRCAPELGVNNTAAADLVFLDPSAARAFINQAREGIFIRGSRVHVGWNRNRVKPASEVFRNGSRVLRINGPENRLSIEILVEFFKNYF
jgi:hypothetical protein